MNCYIGKSRILNGVRLFLCCTKNVKGSGDVLQCCIFAGMLRKVIFLWILWLPLGALQAKRNSIPDEMPKETTEGVSLSRSITPDAMVFEKAFAAFQLLNDSGLRVFAIIDYTKPSTVERFFIYDADKKILLQKLLVAHGKNSGENFATHFSNKNGSLKSSPGFYRTGSTYVGKHGYSLRLYGLESGFNDHAYERAIVIHGADYVNERFIKTHQRLGRSWGCPAISNECSKSVIDLIKNGAVIYIHTNDQNYLSKSTLYNGKH